MTARKTPAPGPPPVATGTIEYRESDVRCPHCRGWHPRLLITDAGDLLCQACLDRLGARQ
jgi:hypothetical protein